MITGLRYIRKAFLEGGFEMRNIIKKCIAVFTVLLLCLQIAACGRKPEFDDSDAASVDSEYYLEQTQGNEEEGTQTPDNDESLKQEEPKQEETKKEDESKALEPAQEEPKQEVSKIEEEPKQEEPENLDTEEKRYCHATIDDEFDGSTIIVVLDLKNSGVNKVHDIEFFGTFPKVYVEDIFKITRYSKNEDGTDNYDQPLKVDDEYIEELGINKETFHQIYEIKLPIDSKQNVLDCIKELEKIDGIRSAGPNYIMYMDW